MTDEVKQFWAIGWATTEGEDVDQEAVRFLVELLKDLHKEGDSDGGTEIEYPAPWKEPPR